MRNLCLYVCALGLILPTFAQDFDEGYLVTDKLPEVVFKQVNNEFSIYYPDTSSPDSRVSKLQKEFITYKVENKFGDQDFLVFMDTEDGSLVAEFSAKGKLKSVVESYKNAKLPEKARKSLARLFPNWSIVKGKYLYVQRNSSVKIKQYKVIIKKENKIKRVVVNDNGEILRLGGNS